ncbi:MAG TPA: hypothetical protein DIT97_02150 [Gimesia maris]|uniref:Uncharacterized protein n=1 Tax=Gimesia maris TaxID=122 RepID=A0A3D3R1R8_9PLAN|nr:hypothetical protein [Gimesia maris]
MTSSVNEIINGFEIELFVGSALATEMSAVRKVLVKGARNVSSSGIQVSQPKLSSPVIVPGRLT